MLQCYQHFINADCRTASDIIVTNIVGFITFNFILDTIIHTLSNTKNPLEFVMAENGRWPELVMLNESYGTLTVILDHSALHPSSVINIHFFILFFLYQLYHHKVFCLLHHCSAFWFSRMSTKKRQ